MGDDEKSKVQTQTKEAKAGVAVTVSELAALLPPKTGPLLPDGLAVKVLPSAKDFPKENVLMSSESAARRLKITKSKDDVSAGYVYLKRLQVLKDMLSGAADLNVLRQRVKERKELVGQVFQQNMTGVFTQQRQLEKTYRELDAFFYEARLSQGEDVAFISIVNASADKNFSEIMDPQTGLAAKLPNKENFDMQSLIGMFVIPEWAGSEAKLVKYGELAQQSMAHLFTGFPDMSLKDAQEKFNVGEEFAELKSADVVKQSISVVANPLRIRKKNRFEKEDFYINPAGILAGKVYKGDVTDGIHIARANVQFSKVALPTPDGSPLEMKWDVRGGKEMKFNKAIIPLAYNQGIVFWGVDTLFQAGDPAFAGMDQYTVKRCDEYIAKVVLHYLNSRTFVPQETKSRDEMFSALSRFLMHNTGGDRMMLNEGKVIAVDIAKNPDGTENQQAIDVKISVNYKNAIRQLNLYLVSSEQHQWKEGGK